jgi:hypothetical protein
MNRRSGISLGTLFGIGFVIPMVIGFVIAIAFAWVAGSTITSGIKAASDSCGKTYPVERVFSGDWFCPEEEIDTDTGKATVLEK